MDAIDNSAPGAIAKVFISQRPSGNLTKKQVPDIKLSH
jgi:hypothetical protein